MFAFDFGEEVQDVMTGFRGVVTARRQDMHSPPVYLVEPRDLEFGRPIEGRWLDARRLVRRETTKPVKPSAGIGFGEGLPVPRPSLTASVEGGAP